MAFQCYLIESHVPRNWFAFWPSLQTLNNASVIWFTWIWPWVDFSTTFEITGKREISLISWTSVFFLFWSNGFNIARLYSIWYRGYWINCIQQGFVFAKILLGSCYPIVLEVHKFFTNFSNFHIFIFLIFFSKKFFSGSLNPNLFVPFCWFFY